MKRTFRIPAVASGLPGMAGALLHLEFRTTGCMHQVQAEVEALRVGFELFERFPRRVRRRSERQSPSRLLIRDPDLRLGGVLCSLEIHRVRTSYPLRWHSVPSTPRSIHPAFTASNISSAGPVWPFGMPECSSAFRPPGTRDCKGSHLESSGLHTQLSPRLHPR